MACDDVCNRRDLIADSRAVVVSHVFSRMYNLASDGLCSLVKVEYY